MTFDTGSFVLGIQTGVCLTGAYIYGVHVVGRIKKAADNRQPEAAPLSSAKKEIADGLIQINNILKNALHTAVKEMNSGPQRTAVLTKAMQERGPIPDVPAVKWTDDAVLGWLRSNGFDINRPIATFQDTNSGDILFKQPERSSI